MAERGPVVDAVNAQPLRLPLYRSVRLAPGVDMQFAWVPDSILEGANGVLHPLGTGFWMSRTEVTNREWAAITGHDAGGDSLPVVNVSWNRIVAALDSLSRGAGLTLRLPTAREWSRAAAAGSTARWHFGSARDSLDLYAWTRENAMGRIRQVASRRPNAFGLFDVHGNVWEWVADSTPAVTDSGGVLERVRLGGSVQYTAGASTLAHRYRQPADRGNGNIGFRIALEPTVTDP